MSRVLSAILFFIILSGCTDHDNPSASTGFVASDSLISPEKMILILADVHEVEAGMQLERNEKVGLNTDPGFYYKGIFTKYHISRGRYDQNLAFYHKDPEQFAKMYEKVIALIESRQQQLIRK